MPTFNQLVRKGRESVEKKVYRSSSSERMELPEERSDQPEFSTETWCMYCNQNPDTKETKLRAA